MQKIVDQTRSAGHEFCTEAYRTTRTVRCPIPTMPVLALKPFEKVVNTMNRFHNKENLYNNLLLAIRDTVIIIIQTRLKQRKELMHNTKLAAWNLIVTAQISNSAKHRDANQVTLPKIYNK